MDCLYIEGNFELRTMPDSGSIFLTDDNLEYVHKNTHLICLQGSRLSEVSTCAKKKKEPRS